MFKEVPAGAKFRASPTGRRSSYTPRMPESNRSGIGAKVRVTTRIGGNSIRQLRRISGGARNQSGLLAHFGLGDATNVATVRIEWPSGTVQELHDVAAN